QFGDLLRLGSGPALEHLLGVRGGRVRCGTRRVRVEIQGGGETWPAGRELHAAHFEHAYLYGPAEHRVRIVLKDAATALAVATGSAITLDIGPDEDIVDPRAEIRSLPQLVGRTHAVLGGGKQPAGHGRQLHAT